MLQEEDGNKPNVDDTLDFEVIEFNKDSKKIIISHARLHEAVKEEETAKENKKKKAKSKSTRKAVKNLNENVEKTTLGDLDVLASLKDEMEESEKKSDK